MIENRPGAGGAIAIGMVAKAPPDGYLIGLGGAAGLGVSLGVQETAAYDPIKDLAPVTGLASVPFILTASNSLRGKRFARSSPWQSSQTTLRSVTAVTVR